MKKDNMGKLLGVALVVAIICTGLFYMLFAMKANSQTGTTMVVAAKALKAGTVLTAADLKPSHGPIPQLPPGAHRDPQESHRQHGIRRHGAEEPVLNARLATSQSGGGIGSARGHARGFGSFDRFHRRPGAAAQRPESRRTSGRRPGHETRRSRSAHGAGKFDGAVGDAAA